MSHGSEYRYTPGPVAEPCPEHPACLLVRCRRYQCNRLVHLALRSPGQPRRYCSPACRIAEHRRLRG